MLGTGLGTGERKDRGWWARGKGPQVFKERRLVKKEARPGKSDSSAQMGSLPRRLGK